MWLAEEEKSRFFDVCDADYWLCKGQLRGLATQMTIFKVVKNSRSF